MTRSPASDGLAMRLLLRAAHADPWRRRLHPSVTLIHGEKLTNIPEDELEIVADGRAIALLLGNDPARPTIDDVDATFGDTFDFSLVKEGWCLGCRGRAGPARRRADPGHAAQSLAGAIRGPRTAAFAVSDAPAVGVAG